jgi:carboxyl-terminal processing protease
VSAWIRTERIAGRFGYIAFNVFLDPGRLMPAFGRAIESFADTDGLVIDLRGNTGGLSGIPEGLAGWLISARGQSLGTAYNRVASIKLVVYPRPRPYTGPVVVLIDELSMSASEAFAQGLRELGRVHIVGRRSAGALLASNIERLPNGDGFRYVTANFVFPSGTVVEGVGIKPDIEVSHTREALLAGRDLMLEAAVAWLGSQKKGSGS